MAAAVIITALVGLAAWLVARRLARRSVAGKLAAWNREAELLEEEHPFLRDADAEETYRFFEAHLDELRERYPHLVGAHERQRRRGGA